MVDLLLGGSPCQGFSFAGKQLNFSDPRSKLFFDFVKALEVLKPKYFLLENVKMKKKKVTVEQKTAGKYTLEKSYYDSKRGDGAGKKDAEASWRT